KGRNYGLEVTIEKFMTKGFYLLATTSVYKSQYEGVGNSWKSSAWDAGYVVNGLAGKEFALNKNKVDKKVDLRLVFDVKGTYAGGQPAAPIDLDASKLAGEAVYDMTNGYSDKLKDYMRLDANVGFKMLTKKFTQEFTIIAQNVTNRQNPFFERYDAVSQKVQVVNQLGLFVVPTYRITF
ncbi:MAG: hypothetical protein NWS53_04725, partial [Salibacteraceae bacterium]|nr:hypothetical protein [Salibacteraceae bacterium]